MYIFVNAVCVGYTSMSILEQNKNIGQSALYRMKRVVKHLPNYIIIIICKVKNEKSLLPYWKHIAM